MKRFGIIAGLLTVGVVAAAELGGGLISASPAPFNGSVTGNLSATGNLTVLGDAGVAGSVSINGDGGITHNLAVGGILTTGKIVPSTTATYTIGAINKVYTGVYSEAVIDADDVTRLAATGVGNIFRGQVTNGSNVAHKFYNTNALTTGKVIEAFSDNGSTSIMNLIGNGTLTLAAGGLTAAGAVSATNFLITANSGIAGNFNGGYVAIRSGTSNPAAIASFQNGSGAEFSQITMNTAGTIGGMYVQPVQTVSIADNGTGANATATVAPTSNYITASCLDTQGCDITISETGAVAGEVIHIISLTGSAGASENNILDVGDTTITMAGAFAAETGDTITIMYGPDRFYEISRSNN